MVELRSERGNVDFSTTYRTRPLSLDDVLHKPTLVRLSASRYIQNG
jgi:hypothetical protein